MNCKYINDLNKTYLYEIFIAKIESKISKSIT